MKLKFVCALLSCAGVFTSAQEVRLLSLHQNGVLTWTNAQVGGNYRIEWAPSATGPWSSTWQPLTNIAGVSSLLSQAVPMLYRVVWTPPFQTHLTAQAALTLITNRATNANFFIMDVRTSAEYAPWHVKGATNLDVYSVTFTSDLARLDRWHSYLVYCASGHRSALATASMLQLGFMDVYTMTNGFSALTQIPEAAPWLEAP